MIRRNEQTYELTFNPDEDRYELILTLKEIFENSEVGRTYKKTCHTRKNEDQHLDQMVRAARLISGGVNVSQSNLVHGLTLLLDAGEIQPKDYAPSTPLEEVEPDTRPRGRDGKPLTESQARWSEMTEWTNTHSMQEVNTRKRTDPQYAAFVRKAYATEVTHEIPDAVVPVGEPTSSVKQTDALRRFVELYNRTPVSAMKPINGVVTLDGDTVPYAEFQRLLARATNAGLI